jgi:hypothetical protein
MVVRGSKNFVVEVRSAGCLLVSLGISVLVGWLLNIGPLMTVLPGRISMKPNTALGFLCAGVSILILMRRHFSRRQQLLAGTFAAIVFVLGLLNVLEYSFHLDLRIDQLLFRDTVFHCCVLI